MDIKAGAGIEPANSGFADRDLTTWLPRQILRGWNYRVYGICVNVDSSRTDRNQ